MDSPNPSRGGKRKRSLDPSRGGKRKRSLDPTEVIPEAPPTRAADDVAYKFEVLSYLGVNFQMKVVPDLFPRLSDYAGCNLDTLEKYVQGVYAAKSDVERKACKSILDSDSPNASLKHSAELPLGSKARESFLKAFSEKYEDDRSCLKTFTDFIDTCAAGWRSASHLAPYTCLVQSSGAGKSRLVKEFANKRYVIYCCVRETGSSGVPARSSIADVLVPASIKGDRLERSRGFLLYAGFFCACMDQLADFVEKTAEPTAREWCKMQLTEEESGGTNCSGVEFWKEIDKRMTVFRDTVLEDTSSLADENKLIKHLESEMKLSCENLNNLFRSSGLGSEGQALLTFALDESKSLLGKYGASTHFSIFRWVASYLAEGCGIFIVLLDTTSKISNFMPSKIPDASFRYSERGKQLLPAFYAVDTFNILAPKERIWTVSGDSPRDLTSVLFKHFMKGRPLFGSFLQSGSDNKAVRLADVVQLAAEKLLGGIAVEQGMQGQTDHYLAVALLSVRGAVFVKPQSELASSLVAKHLGMCLAISSDRGLVFTGYPSEPVLAEAACRIMNRRSKLDVGEILSPMLPYVREGIVDGGARGELVARILFLMAWDRACKNDTSEYKPRFTIFGDHKVLYTRPLVVREFLHSLADKDQFDVALNGQIDQKEMERFLKGRVFFTHFTSVTYSVKRSDLIDFYERGVAILCKRNQAAVDMIIPVRLCQDDMSYILVQVRNYTHSDGKYKLASLELRPENADLSEEPADYPYLALYLQLGYKIGRVRNLKNMKNDRDATQGARREASGSKDSESDRDPFQMIIGLFSLMPAVYPCLRDEVKPAYGASEESQNSKHLSSLRRAWTDPLYYVESNEPTALGESTQQQAKIDFVKHTCVLTYASSPSGS
jgi:hypothetical protein